MLMNRLISCYHRFLIEASLPGASDLRFPEMLIRSGSVVTLCDSHGWQLWNKAHTYCSSVLYQVSELERIGLYH